MPQLRTYRATKSGDVNGVWIEAGETFVFAGPKRPSWEVVDEAPPADAEEPTGEAE